MSKSVEVSHVAAGLTAIVVGYSSSVILIIEAARMAGANEQQIISWLLVLGLGLGLSCILLSLKYRQPVVTAWSTPGAVLLIGSAGNFSLAEVTGAFISSAIMSLLCAQVPQLTRAIERIPASLSAGMLAGILIPFCLKVFGHAEDAPILTAAFLFVYLLGSRFFPRYLMLVLLVVAAVSSFILSPSAFNAVELTLPTWQWVTPEFSLSATIALAFPLFLITMLSQNLPGIAIMQSHGYKPSSRFILSGLSVLQFFTAPFGGFTYSLAAITAAICMGENAGTNPDKRYLAAVMAGVGYIIAGLCAGSIVIIFTQMPVVITQLLAGLALIATLQNSIHNALAVDSHRQAALLTLLCTASGIILIGVSAPVWGLLLGLIVLMLQGKRVSN